MTNAMRCMVLALLAVLSCGKAAAITCTAITSPATTLSWVAGTAVAMQASFEVTCNRPVGDAATSVSYSVTADNGGNRAGTTNRVTHTSAAVLEYDAYKDAACSTEFRSGGQRVITDAITWGGAENGPKSKQTSFWICITNTAQTAAASGAYTDSIGLSLTSSAGNLTGSSFVTVFAPASCTMTTLPGQINLSYTAFGPQVSSSTPFGVNCTMGMPYTMSLDATQGVASGLRYTLSLAQSAANGTGAAQNYSVTATIPAGQAGTCAVSSCAQNVPHTLTIRY